MFHVEKGMFHAADDSEPKIFDKVNPWEFPLYHPTENGGFKMKKLLVFMLALSTTLSLAACGTNAEGETPPPQQQASLSDEQAKADEDYAKLLDFSDRISTNYQSLQELVALTDEVKNGQKEESVLLDAQKQLADDSAGMLADLQDTVWATKYYDDKVTALTDCVEAIAAYQQTLYEASSQNDESMLETLKVQMEEYEAKLSVFLDAMGV